MKLFEFLKNLDEDTNIIICIGMFMDTWLSMRKVNQSNDNDNVVHDDSIVYYGKYSDFKAHQLVNIIDSCIVEIGMLTCDMTNVNKNGSDSYIFLSIRNNNELR